MARAEWEHSKPCGGGGGWRTASKTVFQDPKWAPNKRSMQMILIILMPGESGSFWMLLASLGSLISGGHLAHVMNLLVYYLGSLIQSSRGGVETKSKVDP